MRRIAVKMNDFLGTPAFSAGSRSYTWSDAVLAALLRGEWTAFVQEVHRRLRLSAAVESRDQAPTDEELEAAAEEFRYERDLITAEDMEAWLGRRGLAVDDWMEFVERALVASREAGDPEADQGEEAEGEGAISSHEAGAAGDASSALAADVLCSGALERFAAELAARVAIDDGATPEEAAQPSREQIDRLVCEFSDEIAGCRSLGFAAPDERLAELARLELVFRGQRRRLSSGPALSAQIDAHRLDWVRLDLQGISFTDESAAREAALCLREDGESLEQVALNAHIRMREEVVFLDEIDPLAKPDLLSASPGELVGPVAFGERFHLFLLREKTMPSAEDPEVRRRAEEALLAKTVERETSTRIRWTDPR